MKTCLCTTFNFLTNTMVIIIEMVIMVKVIIMVKMVIMVKIVIMVEMVIMVGMVIMVEIVITLQDKMAYTHPLATPPITSNKLYIGIVHFEGYI